MGRREFKIKPAGASVLLSLAAIVCARLFLLQSFDGSRQGRYYAMASGLLGSRGAALAGQSGLLGKVYRFCYGVTSSFPWYTIMLFCAGAVSLAVTGFVLCSVAEKRQMLLLQLILTGYFAISLMGKLSSETAACALTSAGVLLLFYAGSSWRKRFPLILAVLPALLLGSLLHFALFILCFSVMTGSITADILLGSSVFAGWSGSVYSPAGRERGKAENLILFLLPALAALLLAICLHRADRKSLSGDETVTMYRQEAELAGLLKEYGLPEYEENKETYDSLGISEANYYFFRDTGNYDYTILTAGAMRTLIGLRRYPVLSISSLKAFADHVLPKMGKTWYFSGAVTIFVLCLLLGRRNRRMTFALLGELLVCGILCYVFWCRMFAVTGGAAGICYLTAVLCMFNVCVKGFPDNIGKDYFLLAGICAVILCMYFLRDQQRSRNSFISDRWNTNYHVLEVLHSDPDHFYFRKEGILSYENCADPWKKDIGSVAYNTAFIGLEDIAPEDRERLREEYQVTDPWKDMIGNDKVYLIDDDIDQTLRYLRKNYSKKVKAAEAGKLDDRTVYRIW